MSSFDKFISEFYGLIDVLCDRMKEEGLEEEAQELIYQDLLEKIVPKMYLGEFLEKTYREVPPRMDIYRLGGEVVKFYLSWNGEYYYAIIKIGMVTAENNPDDIVYQGIFDSAINQYRGEHIQFGYKIDIGEVEKWMERTMKMRGDRILGQKS